LLNGGAGVRATPAATAASLVCRERNAVALCAFRV
jgi:hypothetical protein